MRRGEVYRLGLRKGSAVDHSRLGKFHGELAPSELWGVDLALGLVLDLT